MGAQALGSSDPTHAGEGKESFVRDGQDMELVDISACGSFKSCPNMGHIGKTMVRVLVKAIKLHEPRAVC